MKNNNLIWTHGLTPTHKVEKLGMFNKKLIDQKH